MADKILDVGDFLPDFTANGSWTRNVTPPDGILKGLIIHTRGTHVTAITAGGQQDGELNTIPTFRCEVKRAGSLGPVIWTAEPRDLKFIKSYFDGQLTPEANPAGDGAAHFATFFVPFVPPARKTEDPAAWGIDTSTISGSIILTGTYGGVTSIGPSATAIAQVTSVTAVVGPRNPGRPPFMALAGSVHRITYDSARREKIDLATAEMEAVVGVFIRTLDSSAVSADRVDGLFTRIEYKHTNATDLERQLFIMAKNRGANEFGLAAADVPAGISFHLFNDNFALGNMLDLRNNQTLEILLDSDEAVPAGVTNVAPGAGDAVFATVIGVKFSAVGVATAAAVAATGPASIARAGGFFGVSK